MKKLIILTISFLLFSAAAIFAQANPLDNFIEQYSGEKGFQYLELKTNMIPGDENNESAEERMIFLKMVLFNENGSTKYTATDIHSDFLKKFDKESYVGLVDIKSSGDQVELLVKKENQMVTEFVICICEEQETTLIAASGNFDLKNLAKLSKFKDCKGLHILEKLCEE
ncbi:MAG: DUF4252 domain-containing protein [Bacteroidales bacterium]